MRKRWIGLTSAISIILLLLLFLNIETILKDRLNNLIIQDSSRVYDYHLEELEINFFARSIVINELIISPRLELQNNISNQGSAYRFHLKSMRLNKINFLRLLYDNQLKIGLIEFDEPEIVLYRTAQKENEDHRPANKKLVSNVLSKSIQNVSIEELSIIKASAKIIEVNKDSNLILNAAEMDLNIYGIHTNGELLRGPEVFNFDSTVVGLYNLSYGGLKDYQLHMNSLKINSQKKSVQVEGLSMKPFEDKFNFMSHQKEENDWFNCSLEKLIIQGFDIDRFQRQREIFAENLLIDSASIEIYRDKRKKDKALKRKELPASIIRKMDPAIQINTIELKSSSLNYLEHEIDAKEPIAVHLRDLNLNITNLTSDSGSLAENNLLQLTLETQFMKGGQLKISSDFFLQHPLDSFYIDAELTNLPLTSLNPILKESAFVQFQEGMLQKLILKLEADDQRAKGSLDIDYSGLKHISLLRKKSELNQRMKHHKRSGREKQFLSFLAERIIYENYGPEEKYYHQGEINIERVPHKSIVNYTVSAIKDGMMNSLLHSHPKWIKKLKKQN